MRLPTPLPAQLQHRPFRVAEALALGVTHKRLRGHDLRAPFHGVRVPIGLPWGVRLRARAGLLVVPPGSLVVGLHALAVAGLPVPLDDAVLMERPLSVAVPVSLREPRPRTGLDVGTLPWRTRCRTVLQDGVRRPADEDLWAHVVGAGAPLLAPHDAEAVGRAVLARAGGDLERLAAALERVPPAVATRARRHLERLRDAERP